MIAQTTITVIYHSTPWWHRSMPVAIACGVMVVLAFLIGRDL